MQNIDYNKLVKDVCEQNITQKDLSKFMNVSLATVSRVSRDEGKTSKNVKTSLIALAVIGYCKVGANSPFTVSTETVISGLAALELAAMAENSHKLFEIPALFVSTIGYGSAKKLAEILAVNNITTHYENNSYVLTRK